MEAGMCPFFPAPTPARGLSDVLKSADPLGRGHPAKGAIAAARQRTCTKARLWPIVGPALSPLPGIQPKNGTRARTPIQLSGFFTIHIILDGQTCIGQCHG